jgi:UTP-glucose-1-phosphate uridylyltransferase/mevalonate kinase
VSAQEENFLEIFVPGRLCLFGEHSDWAGQNKTFNSDIVPGRAIVTGIEQGICAMVSKAVDFQVKSKISEYQDSSFSCKMEKDTLRQVAKEGGFFSYVAGVASYMCEWYRVGGAHIEITKMDLPMKSGLSSSAAVCVLVTKAFNELYHLQLNTLGIMNIAYWGEQRTPSRCGRLDQACAFGTNPVAMNFDGNELDVDRIRLKAPLYYVFADLMSHKNTVKILADLNSGYPFPKNEKEQKLHDALGKDNREITQRAMDYMLAGNAESLGKLMVEAQKIFDEKVAPMCPEELTSPVLHKTLNDPRCKELSFGGKGVGSQGDGTIQFLAKDMKCQETLIRYLHDKLNMTAYSLTLKPKALVRKAVIPVAGFGTRLYPETRSVKKEFCPVVDKDGLMKPGILVLLEELNAIEDIEEICLILNEEEKKYYEEFFFSPLNDAHYDKLSNKMKAYEKTIREIAGKIRFAYQQEQKGFGHAVYQSKHFASGEPVLLLLGDTIYQTNTGISCTKQLLDAYQSYGHTMVALQPVQLENVGNFGLFAGTWENKSQTILKVSNVKEKPSVQEAQEYMSVPNDEREDNYYGAFGSYIITSDIYERLDDAIKKNMVNNKGEIELTDAFGYLCDHDGLLGFVPNGLSFDLGNPDAYRYAVANFGKVNH